MAWRYSRSAAPTSRGKLEGSCPKYARASFTCDRQAKKDGRANFALQNWYLYPAKSLEYTNLDCRLGRSISKAGFRASGRGIRLV